MIRSTKTLALVLAAIGASCSGSEDTNQVNQPIVAGAGYTTFEVSLDGCLDSPNGVNCNNYEAKKYVYMSGGPTKAGLEDGAYYFTVLTPGAQNGGFLDGAKGNLSDVYAGGTAGDLGSGDSIENRTFRVAGHDVVAYAGTHPTGFSPQGHFVIGLAPFDDTDNPGGVYILAVCKTGAQAPSDCKYDAFRIAGGDAPVWGQVWGAKYYDANTNGMLDPGEVRLAGWPIAYSDGISGVVYTEEDGSFHLDLTADGYHFSEVLPLAPTTWMQTGNLVDQTVSVWGASASLLPDKSYDVTVVDGSTVEGVYFGNVCLGAGGGHTLGFWSNKNGKALFGVDDLGVMKLLDLRDAAGDAFDPPDYLSFRTWLLGANATNMAYMLSAQLAAMGLNVLNNFVDPTALVYAPGVDGVNANGFIGVRALIDMADRSLASNGYTPDGSPARAQQEALKDALDAANNNESFVQPTPATCPAPLFP